MTGTGGCPIGLASEYVAVSITFLWVAPFKALLRGVDIRVLDLWKRPYESGCFLAMVWRVKLCLIQGDETYRV